MKGVAEGNVAAFDSTFYSVEKDVQHDSFSSPLNVNIDRASFNGSRKVQMNYGSYPIDVLLIIHQSKVVC